MPPKKTTKNEPTKEIPLVSVQLERSLLACLLDHPEFVESLQLQSGHFGLAAHQTIAKAIELVAVDRKVNITNIAVLLKQTDRLAQIGGTAYLAELIDNSPHATLDDALSWQQQLRALWEKRRMLDEARGLVAKLETGSVDDHFEAFNVTAFSGPHPLTIRSLMASGAPTSATWRQSPNPRRGCSGTRLRTSQRCPLGVSLGSQHRAALARPSRLDNSQSPLLCRFRGLGSVSK